MHFESPGANDKALPNELLKLVRRSIKGATSCGRKREAGKKGESYACFFVCLCVLLSVLLRWHFYVFRGLP